MLIAVTVLICANSWVIAEPSPKITPIADPLATIELNGDQSADIQLGFSLVVTSKTRILSVRGFNPNVVTVEAFGAKAIRILSKTAGTSPVVIREEGGAENKLDIRVFSKSLNQLDALLRRLYPDTKLVLHEVGAGLLIRGEVADVIEAEQILEIGKQFYPEVLDQLRRKDASAALSGTQKLSARPNHVSNPKQVASKPETRTFDIRVDSHLLRLLNPGDKIDVYRAKRDDDDFLTLVAADVTYNKTSGTTDFNNSIEIEVSCERSVGEKVLSAGIGKPLHFRPSTQWSKQAAGINRDALVRLLRTGTKSDARVTDELLVMSMLRSYLKKGSDPLEASLNPGKN
ncbi:MAG: hypothetical protein O3A00_14695 [Planctomycetota bacterium]|nr:hypothetical protein [Planctomycetota bacterium]